MGALTDKPIAHIIRVRLADQRREVSLSKSEFLIGRDPATDVVIDVFEISRRHATVRILGGRIYIRDLGSSNGTFVSGKKLRPDEEVALNDPNEEICLAGKAWLSFVPAERVERGTGVSRTASLQLQIPISEPAQAAAPVQAAVPIQSAAQTAAAPAQLRDRTQSAIKQIEHVQEEAVRFAENLKEEARLEAAAIREHTKQEYGTLMVEVEKLRAQRDEIKPVVDELYEKSESCRKTVEELEARKQMAENMINTLEERRETMERESITAQREKDRFTQEAQQAGEQLASVRTELERTQHDLQKTKTDFDEDFKKRKVLTDTAEAEFRLKKVSLEATIGELELKRVETQRTLQTTQTQLASVEAQKAETIKQTEDLKAQSLKQLEDMKLQSQKQMDELKERSEKQVTELNAEATKAQQTLDEAKDQIKITTSELQRRLEETAQAEQARLRAQEAVEAETRQRRDTLEKEMVTRAQEMQRQLADSKLREMEKISRMERDARDQQKERTRFMATEIARVVFEISGGGSVSGRETELKAGILAALEGKSLSNVEAARKTRAFWRKTGTIAASVIGVGTLLYLNPGIFNPIRARISRTIASENQGSGIFMNEIKERGSTYQPATDHDYRDTYTDNILYLEGYVQMKMDDDAQRKWTLALNDFVIHRLQLSDRVVPDLLSDEMVMLKDLLRQRENILIQFKDQGIARMVSTEHQDIIPIRALLQTGDNYRRFRDLEKSFYEDYITHQPLGNHS